MPFYFRKSVSAGPFRFNFSKGGVGGAVGVKGLRIGTGPRGHYVHAGRGGIYYRASLGPKKQRSSRAPNSGHSLPPGSPAQQPSIGYDEPAVEMIRVSSGDVLQMQDERFTDLLGELNDKQRSWSSAWPFAGVGLAVGALLIPAIGILTLAIGLLGGIALGLWRDSYNRSAVLFYELDEGAQKAYEALTAAFDQLMACRGKWRIDAGGAVRDLHTWKRNAGAGHLVDRRPTFFGYSLPKVVNCNITPPMIQVGKETLYFLPDVMLVVEKEKVGAVAYDTLSIRFEDSSFIEDGIVPADAKVIRQTWRHPNKSGGPDRRFRDNRMLPVCLYESIHLNSSNGLNELVQVSRKGMAQPLVEAVRRLIQATGNKPRGQSVPRL